MEDFETVYRSSLLPGKEFKTAAECQKAVHDYKVEVARRDALAAQKDAKKQEVDNLFKDYMKQSKEAYEKYLKAREQFVKDYGSYEYKSSKTYDVDDGGSFESILDNFFRF